MRRALLVAAEQFVIDEVPIPAPGPADVIIQVEQAGICGSDVHIYHGVSRIQPPVVLGHEFSGTIYAMGDEVEGFEIGDRVLAEPGVECGNCTYCRSGRYNLCVKLYTIGGWSGHDGAYADYVRVPASKLFRMPDDMTFQEGALVELVACATHALDVADIEHGDVVLVIGAGPIGNLLAQASKMAGASYVAVADVVDERLALARQLGADSTVNAAEVDLVDWARETCGVGGINRVFDAASTPHTFQQAIQIVRWGGRVINVGVPTRTVEWHPRILLKEIELTGMNMYVRRNFEEALEALKAGQIQIKPLITASYPLAQIDHAYGRVMHDPARSKVFLAPQTG